MNTTKKTNHAAVYGALVIFQCFLWGVGNPIQKMGLETIPPLYYISMRFGAGFVIFMVFFGRGIIKDFKKDYWLTSIIIGLFTAATFILSNFALLLTSATVTGFLMSLSVVFTPVLAFLVLKDRIDKKLILTICVIVVGMYLLCANGGAFTFGWGELCALLTAIAGSAMLIYSSKHVSYIGPITLSTIQMGVSALVCIIFALFFEDASALRHVSSSGWGSLIYVTIGCTCVVYLIQNFALQKVSAVFVSLAFCSEPIFTAIASFFILGETLSLKGFLGCGLIIAGLVLATLLTAKKEEADIDDLKKAVEDATQTKGGINEQI